MKLTDRHTITKEAIVAIIAVTVTALILSLFNLIENI